MRQRQLTPITEAAFAPFGRLIRHDAAAVIADASMAFGADAAAPVPVMEWVQPAGGIRFPFRVARLERHPFSAQTFLPDGRVGFMVLVCPSDATGAPDLQAIRCFQVPPDRGVTFHRGVWHHGLSALSHPSRFVMAMRRTGLDNDTEFHDLPPERQFEISSPAETGAV